MADFLAQLKALEEEKQALELAEQERLKASLPKDTALANLPKEEGSEKLSFLEASVQSLSNETQQDQPHASQEEQPEIQLEGESPEEIAEISFEERIGLEAVLSEMAQILGHMPVADIEEENGFFAGTTDPLFIKIETTLRRFAGSLKQLDDLLASESAMLERYEFSELVAMNNRKTRLLYELTTALENSKAFSYPQITSFLRHGLSYLQNNLQRNAELLEIHLQAVGELAQIVRKAVEAHETDGTYSPYATSENTAKIS